MADVIHKNHLPKIKCPACRGKFSDQRSASDRKTIGLICPKCNFVLVQSEEILQFHFEKCIATYMEPIRKKYGFSSLEWRDKGHPIWCIELSGEPMNLVSAFSSTAFGLAGGRLASKLRPSVGRLPNLLNPLGLPFFDPASLRSLVQSGIASTFAATGGLFIDAVVNGGFSSENCECDD